MEHYEIISSLGKGMSGSVDLVRDLRDNQIFVLKKIECSDETIASIALKEYLQLELCWKYPFVQKCHEAFVAWETKKCTVFFCIVAEYFPKGDFGKVVSAGSRLDADVLLRWVGQLLDAVIRLHGDGVVHRNIKPSNIFLREDDSIVFGDFGIMTLMNEPCVQKGLLERGDSMWSSPESLQSGVYEQQSDVWSLGCLFIALMSCGGLISEDKLRVSLFHLKTNPEMLDDLLDDIRNFHGNDPSSLIRSVLRSNIHQRPTAFELCDQPYIIQCLTVINSDFNPKLLADSTNEEDIILVKLMKASKSTDSQVTLLKQLIDLAHKRGQGFTLKSATVNHIVKILYQHSRSLDIQVLGLTALYLTRNGDDQNLYLDDLIRLITNAIKEHSTSKALLIIATHLLTELAMKNEGVRQHIIDSELVLNLLKSVKYLPDSLDLLIVFSILLMTLITDDHVSSIVVASGIVEVMVNALQSSNLVNTELINAILPVFAYLSTSDKHLPFLLAKGIPTLIIDIMSRHEQDITVLKFSCFILQSMCEIQVDCIYYIVDPKSNCKEGLKCILNTLKAHTNNEELVESITKLLMIISRNDDIMYELSTLDITTTLSLVLQQFHSSEQLRKQLQKLITSFLDD